MKQSAEAYTCRMRACIHACMCQRSFSIRFECVSRMEEPSLVFFVHPPVVAGSSRNRFENLTRILPIAPHVFTLLNRILNDLNVTPIAAGARPVLRLTLSLSLCHPPSPSAGLFAG